ncbi:chemotaxis-specific methylesterase CheB [Mycolicibacterium fortuitum subsp. acetamidolyticum]|uniref:protein-glutamate methylesterase n=1 Tax=Mycolicibacterium fortuitum subsp. acetamidolyticum TaxID=144550 RepID=A0A100WWL9_MYCFO|nr:chemotaxis-specific methylesterase CheB [Mycolicibacterium fortuitum subsp. acetamidolyticum]
MTDNDEKVGLIAVGASAGGVEALTRLVSGLPSDLAYPVVVVLHLPADTPSALARILDRAGPLPSTTATNGVELKPGTIYVGVPDRHLLVEEHRILLTEGPTENGHRPAINALFRSAALAYGSRAVSVLLSGCSTTVSSARQRSSPGAAPPLPKLRPMRCFPRCRPTRSQQG